MARPKTDALIYFNIDVKEDDNLKYIEAVYGHLGYYVILKLWKQIYGGPGGYFCEWKDINQRLFCKENNVDYDKLQAIIQTCFEEGVCLFDKTMFEKHRILTSTGIQKRWKKIVTEAGRKNCHIKPEYCLINTAAIGFPGVETTPPPTLTGGLQVDDRGNMVPEMPQSKVKESKVKKSTVLQVPNSTKLASPATAGAVTAAKNLKPEKKRDYWQPMVDTWFEFYRKKFSGEEPNFPGRNVKIFEKIYDMLALRARKKGSQWTQQYATDSLLFFLNQAYADPWLQNHFLLENLVKQFDAIFSRAIKKKSDDTKAPEKKSFNEEVSYIVSRIAEGTFDERVVTAEYYDLLVVRGYLQPGSLANTEGKTIEEKKRTAALDFFKKSAAAATEKVAV